jgi:hypothetical protein
VDHEGIAAIPCITMMNRILYKHVTTNITDRGMHSINEPTNITEQASEIPLGSCLGLTTCLIDLIYKVQRGASLRLQRTAVPLV